ncbi:MAG TPA: hypothetical protein EYO05_03555 [Gammaproteobacteria bacterium]|nr:hypothetical protein [Gammaproteobacteria bacterium]
MLKFIGRHRPSFLAVLLVANLTILVLPVVGTYVLYRLYEGTHLVRSTEGDLIAQGAILSAAYTTAFSRILTSESDRKAYGVPVNEKWHQVKDPETEPFRPIKPRLNKLRDDIYLPAPNSTTGTEPDPIAIQVGQDIQPALIEAKVVTLTGIRIVDFNGTVVATSGTQLGESISNREDVQQTLEGKYTSLLRQRVTDSTSVQLGQLGRRGRVRVFVNLPIILDGRVLGAVVLSRTPPKGFEAIKELPRRIVQVSIVLLIFVLLISIFVAVKVNRPVLVIIQQAKRQIQEKKGRFGLLERPVTKEFAELSSTVAQMVNELERRAKESDQMLTELQSRAEYARDLSSQVTHAFKTPLSGIGGATELLRDGFQTMSDDDRKKFIAMIEQDTRKLDLLVERLLELSRADYLDIDQTDKTNPAKTLESIKNQYRYRELSLKVKEEATDTTINMSDEIFESIVISIIDNAYQHGGDNVNVELELTKPLEARNMIRIVVSDDGRGISPANSGKIFQHFFTTAHSGENSGLGLSIVRSLLGAHGGKITLLPSKVGAYFQIDIPLAS